MSKTNTSHVPGFDSPQQAAFLQLWRTYDCLKAIEEQLFSQYDLSAQQYNALRLLQSAHPESLRTLTIASRLISRSPDITRMLDRLEKAGWILRERKSDNRRVVEVSITKNGLALLKKLDPKVKQMHDRQLGHLDNQQLAVLTQLIKIARQPHEASLSEWESPGKESSSKESTA